MCEQAKKIYAIDIFVGIELNSTLKLNVVYMFVITQFARL